MSPAGYSGTPLAKKLGIGEGARVRTIDAPADYAALVAPLPAGARVSSRLAKDVDLVHLFATSERGLVRSLPRAQAMLVVGGRLWISWPKRASGVATDLTEDVLRRVVLPTGWVDVKVCAVDATWSGLAFVLRTELRRKT